MQSRQATQRCSRCFGAGRNLLFSTRSNYSAFTRAAEHYGSRQVVSRPGRFDEQGPTISRSGSESDSEPEEVFPLLDSEVKPEVVSGNFGPLAGLGGIGGIVLLLAGGVLMKDTIRDFLVFFIDAVENWGPLGYLAYAAVYTGLEVLAVPAIPLTMTAGVIFGPIPGTIIVSLSGTAAATIAFLIARYAARDRVMRWARRNAKFAAIDRAIAKNGFKFVTLLRLSPLFPLAASNYLYGLTSVDLWPYVAGSWLGMLPGTYAYVSTGHLGKAALLEGEGIVGVESWEVALGLGVTLLAIGYVGRLAKNAIEEEEAGSDISDCETEGPGMAESTNGNGKGSNGNGSNVRSSTNGTGFAPTVYTWTNGAADGSESGSGNGNGSGHRR